MADLSDESDINPEKIARIVEDIDSLDNNLFNSAFKKTSNTKVDAKDSIPYNTTDVKKKVIFKDHNKEDPLADLLSDEEEIPQKQKNVVMQSTKSTLMESLFGIKTITSSASSIRSNDKPMDPVLDIIVDNSNPVKSPLNQDNQLDLQEKSSQNKLLKQADISRTHSTSYINDGTTASLLNKSKSTTDKSQKSSLMEDLFRNKQSLTSVQNTSSQQTFDSVGTKTTKEYATADVFKGDNPSNATMIGYAPTVSASREPRRRRKSSTRVHDPLGLLSSSQSEHTVKLSSEKVESSTESAKSKSVNQDLPEWLGGSKKTDNRKFQNAEQSLEPYAELNTEQQKELLKNDHVQHHDYNVNRMLKEDNDNTNDVVPHYEGLPMLIGAQFDQHAAIMTMQQQEHELRTATTLSYQNDQLTKLIETQNYKLAEQDKQFNMLIKKQIDRQILLEAQMKQQQERINHYIQTLISQPTSLPIPNITLKNKLVEEINEEEDAKITLDKSIEKLQSEKLCLENTLKSLNERHENELAIYEDSYKRQITFLQERMNELEKRFHREIEILQSDYESNIEKIREEKIQIERMYKEEIENLKKGHLISIQEMSERHSINIKLLQKEHSESLENISTARNCEKLAVTAVTSLKLDMEQMLDKATALITNIESVHEKLEDKDEIIEKSAKEQLKQEKQSLEVEGQYIKRQKEILEEERKNIMNTIQQLELQFVQLTSEIKKRSVCYDEAEERLKTKEQMLTNERKLFEQKIIWEHKHLETLSDTWIKEQERQLKVITQEKEAIATERAKVEVFSRLKCDTNDLTKLELEAAIKAAQEANNRTNQERLKWQSKLKELEIQQHQIQEKENELILRAKELDSLTQSALTKRDEGMKALKQARQIEDQHKERLSQLQLQLEALAQRENKIASEKLYLAKERLALRTYTEKPVKDVKINIDSTYEDHAAVSSELPVSQFVSPYMDMIDPQLIMLKLNLDNQLDISNQCLETMGLING